MALVVAFIPDTLRWWSAPDTGGGMNAGEWIQVCVAVVLAVTLGAVLWYAWQTKRQADATMDMAREMRAQRLDPDRPYLLIEVPRLHAVEWKELGGGGNTEPDPYAACPKSISYRIYNAGRGPAKEIVTTLLQPLVAYSERKKDVLRAGESWEVEVKESEASALLRQAFAGRGPLGLEAWMKVQGVRSRSPGSGYDCGLLVLCTDIQERRWATYSRFGLQSTIDNVRKVVTSRVLVPVEQQVVRLSGDNGEP